MQIKLFQNKELDNNSHKDYEFINNALFFPNQGILVIGDLHLGYEEMLQKEGVHISLGQLKELRNNLDKIVKIIQKNNYKLNEIIFLGDITHAFAYEWSEKNYYKELMKITTKYVSENKIILIKGNHDTIDYTYKEKLRNYHISSDKKIAFLHGHKDFKEIYAKNVKTLVLGHLHPSVVLKDKQNIRKEKFKCFLIGKFKGKKIIIIPSFLNSIEGSTINIDINNYKEDYEDFFSIIPKKYLMNLEVYVIEESDNKEYKDNKNDGNNNKNVNKIYKFGKVKDLNT